ncbi:hypothetical protein MKW92_002417 [Papaver armeniacum]|nr:hypothetical protein MKW92_002417 [Papaver armeniacum]
MTFGCRVDFKTFYRVSDFQYREKEKKKRVYLLRQKEKKKRGGLKPPNLLKLEELNKQRLDDVLMVQNVEDDKKIKRATWIIDSGACDHFTDDLDLLENQTNCYHEVGQASMNNIVCLQKGSAKISCCFAVRGVEGHEIVSSRVFNLSNVYYHADLENIISPARFNEDNNCSIEILKEIYLIKESTAVGEFNLEDHHNVVAMGRVEGGQYIYKSDPSQKQNPSSTTAEYAGGSKDNKSAPLQKRKRKRSSVTNEYAGGDMDNKVSIKLHL